MARVLLLLGTLVGVLLLVVLLFGVYAVYRVRGSGQIQRETREVHDFTQVNFTSFGELAVVQGESEGLTIEADANLLPYIESTVDNGVLTLGMRDRPWLWLLRSTPLIRYTLAVKTLTDLDFSGAGTVHAEKLTAGRLTLSESGAGKITVDDLTAEELTVEMSGAGAIELAGRVTGQTVEMSGLGDYQAGDLESQTARISLSGAGTATVWVRERLDATLSGAGSIRYYGSPETNTDTSGVGQVQSLGEK